MKTRLLMIALCSIFSLPSSADIFGNGAGLAEQNFIYTYQKLPQFIDMCLLSPKCKITPTDRAILTDMADQLEKTAKPSDLVFRSENDFPNFFTIDGKVKVAKTYLFLSSTIYINSDIIDKLDKDGVVRPALDIPTMVALLIHEQGHRHNIRHNEQEGNYLDSLGAKVRTLLETRGFVTKQRLDQFEVGIEVYNSPEPKGNSQILLTYGEKNFDLTSYLSPKGISCENGLRWIGSTIENPHWSQRAKYDPVSGWSVTPRAWFTIFCEAPGGIVSAKNLNLYMNLKFKEVEDNNQNKSLVFDSEALEIWLERPQGVERVPVSAW